MRRLLGWVVSQADCQPTSMLCFLAPSMHGLPWGLCIGEGICIMPVAAQRLQGCNLS